MPAIVSRPGIYIEEDHSPSIALRVGNTAVPAIAVTRNNPLLANCPDRCLRIDSWFDYTGKVEALCATPAAPYAMNFSDSRDIAVRAYFENGGGYCYLVDETALEAAIRKHDDVTLFVQSGCRYASLSGGIEKFCEKNMLFAILDVDGEIQSDALATLPAGNHLAAYYPPLQVDWAGSAPVPASVVMAGIYCTVDRQRGVWKAPANVGLPAGYRLRYKTTDRLQSKYTEGAAINFIRNLGHSSLVVWGARTREDSDAWRYIPVRRLFSTVQREVRHAMRSMVFEPNVPRTWEKTRAAITRYLHRLWKLGALTGESENAAFFVQIGDGITMTPEDMANGKMIVKVGMAAVRPAEFIVFKFTQKIGGD